MNALTRLTSRPSRFAVGWFVAAAAVLGAAGLLGSLLLAAVGTPGPDALPAAFLTSTLLLAAERTDEVRREPRPVVFQTALTDFYVQYTLLVSLVNPARRLPSLAVLHANIQDAFNEYGVQIMSPNYEADPENRKLVPPQDWYAAPAAPPVQNQPAMRGEPQAT